MTDETRVVSLLRSAMPPVHALTQPKDLWPRVLTRTQSPAWPWLDLAIAAGVAVTLLVRPDWILVLAYHF